MWRSSPCSPLHRDLMSSTDSYRIKKIRFFGRTVPILCQNENGPCPLLAICNVLLLQSNISIHPDLSEISFSELTQLVAGFLLDSNPPHDDLRINVNQQNQLDAVIKLLPRLQYGLDVNVRFNSPRGFEFTEEMAAFDMTGITLLHGWILDPEDKRTAAVIGGMSYNKLVEKLLEFRSLSGEGSLSSEGAVELSNSHGTGRSVSALAGDGTSPGTESEDMLTERGPTTNVGGQTSETTSNVAEQSSTACSTSSTPSLVRSTVLRAPKDPQEGHPSESSQVHGARSASFRGPGNLDEAARVARVLEEGHVAEEFFRETASQLTYYGLSKLHQEVRERQLCVFFRNNHFSCMFKFETKLYLLITDLGYARESSVVWEKLDQIDGDTEYVDCDFIRSSRCSLVNAEDPPNQQDDQDFMLALALQQEDASSQAPSAPVARVYSGPTPPPLTGAEDEAVAFALQQEERTIYERHRRVRPVTPSTLSADGHEVRSRERRRQAEAPRRSRPESGTTCAVQ